MSDGVERPLLEQLNEAKIKVTLVKADRKAFVESCYARLLDRQNRVAELRSLNKRMRLQLKDRVSADEIIINQAFQNRPTERATLSGKNATEACEIMNYRVCDDMKRLNLLRYATHKKRVYLEQLWQRNSESKRDLADKLATDKGENPEGRMIRDLENRLDKAQLKCGEAQQINKTYQKIKAKFFDEYKTFGKTLDKIQLEIERTKKELEDVRLMHREAVNNAKEAKAELSRHEEIVIAERKRRELEISSLRDLVQRKKAEVGERKEKRVPDDDIAMDGEDEMDGGGGEEVKVSASVGAGNSQLPLSMDAYPTFLATGNNNMCYENVFQQMKVAAGVADLREMVQRFDHQESTQSKLLILRDELCAKVRAVQRQRLNLRHQISQSKFEDESRLNSSQTILQKDRAKVRADEKSFRGTIVRIRSVSELLGRVRAALFHLMEKLFNVKPTVATMNTMAATNDATDAGAIAPDDVTSKPSTTLKASQRYRSNVPRRDEFIFNQINLILTKMEHVKTVLKHHSVEEEYQKVVHDMEHVILNQYDSKVYLEAIVGPQGNNTRVELSSAFEVKEKPVNLLDQPERSDDEQMFHLLRQTMKEQSRALVNARSKKIGQRSGNLKAKKKK